MFKKQPIINSKLSFNLDPAALQFNHLPLVNEAILISLAAKKIQFTLRYIDSAESTKPVLIFLHGNSASSDIFANQYEHYQNQFRIISIDLLGHGDSSKISELDECSDLEKETLAAAFYNPCAMIAEVTQLLLALNIQGAHFVGWSLGGHIAYGVAVECEQLVASVISVGSPPILFSRSGLKKGFGEWFVNTLVPEWIERPAFLTVLEAESIAQRIGLKQDFATFTKNIQRSDPLMRRHLFLELLRYDDAYFQRTALNAERFMEETLLPLCLIVGEKDNGINAQYYLSFAGRFKNPHSLAQVIPNGSHAVFDSHPTEYFQIVDGFLAKVI